MLELKKLIKTYIDDPQSPETNINLAEFYYYKLEQYASALTFYIRCAERVIDQNVQYYCLIMSARCLENTGKRNTLAKSCYNHAINVCPLRPEAYYFLSRNCEWTSDWIESYTKANLGLTVTASDSLDIYSEKLNYTGKHLLIFQKAVAAWWWGKGQESRELFLKLKNLYYNSLDQAHKDGVERNLINLGSIESFRYYNSDNYDKLRFKFKNSHKIIRNFGQVFQDMFVLSMLDGKSNGTYIEIGSADPLHGNNTYLLETQYNWTGVGIEYDSRYTDNYNSIRKNKSILVNALDVDYNSLIRSVTETDTIDYLQLDCEPSHITYNILLKIPFDKYKFGVITYEHDYYADNTKSYRKKSREFLTNLGYVLVVNDICCDKNKELSFEDWWVHPDLINKRILDIMTDNNLSTFKSAEEYMYAINPAKLIDPFSLIVDKSNQVNNQIFNSINISDFRKRFVIVDNFYKYPNEVRQFALQQEYDTGGYGIGYIGHRTQKQFLFTGLKETFENLLGTNITQWEEHPMNGRFQYCTEGQPLVYHCDDQKWAAVLFLTPNAPYEAGTSFWSIKNSDIRDKYHADIMLGFREGAQNLDKTLFELVDRVGNVYNRLVLFDAGLIHSASEYFGFTKENGRLWQMFFFD